LAAHLLSKRLPSTRGFAPFDERAEGYYFILYSMLGAAGHICLVVDRSQGGDDTAIEMSQLLPCRWTSAAFKAWPYDSSFRQSIAPRSLAFAPFAQDATQQLGGGPSRARENSH